MEHRFVIVFSTSTPGAYCHPESPSTPFQYRHAPSRSWKSSVEDPPSFNLEVEDEIKSLSDFLHSSLDDLPTDESFTLDILWIGSCRRVSIPVHLFGALKRASEWHASLIHLPGGQLLSLSLAQYLTPITRKDITPVLWRGSLSFFDGFNNLKAPYEELKGFSLLSSSKQLLKGAKTISRSILVVASDINVSSVPKHYIRDPITLQFECQKSDELFNFFKSTYLHSKRQALILRLEYSSNTKDFGSELKTNRWKEGFQSEDFDPCGCVKQTLGKQPESLFIVAQGGCSEDNSFRAWTLSSEGWPPFEGFHVRQEVLDEMEIPIFKFSDSLDPLAVMDFIKETEKTVLSTLNQVEPNLLDEYSLNDILRIIRKRILKRIGFAPKMDGTFDPHNSPHEEEEGGREEKRFLKFLSEQQRIKEEAKTRANCTAGPGFIKWEVKELLKFFTDEGLAKMKDSQTEVLSSKTKRSIPLEKDQSWPEVLSRDEVMDIVYNTGVESESKDLKRMEILKANIGLKETVSTGPAKTSFPDIIPMPKKMTPPAPEPVKEVISHPRVLRSSPRKKPSASKEDIFKQKLRNAVFNALCSKGIDMKHELFRPCFKKLFEICKMYTGSKVPAGQGSTKEWLNKVALQNVEPVVNLERTLHGSS